MFQLAAAMEILRVLYSCVHSYPLIPDRIVEMQKVEWLQAVNQDTTNNAILYILRNSPVFHWRLGHTVELTVEDLVSLNRIDRVFDLRIDESPYCVKQMFANLVRYCAAIMGRDTPSATQKRLATRKITQDEMIGRFTYHSLLSSSGNTEYDWCTVLQTEFEKGDLFGDDHLHQFVTHHTFKWLQQYLAMDPGYLWPVA